MNECSAFTSALYQLLSLCYLTTPHHSTSSPFPSLNLHSEIPPASPSHSWVSSSHFYPFLSPFFVSSTLKTFLLSSPSFPSVFMFFSSGPFSSSLFISPTTQEHLFLPHISQLLTSTFISFSSSTFTPKCPL